MVTDNDILQSLNLLSKSSVDSSSATNFLRLIPSKVLACVNTRQNAKLWAGDLHFEVSYCGDHVDLIKELGENYKILTIYFLNKDRLKYVTDSATLASYFEKDNLGRIKSHQLFKVVRAGEGYNIEKYTSSGHSYEADVESLEL